MAVSNPNNIIPAIGGGLLQGLPGKDGKNGLSAYELAVEHGYEGTEEEWLQSLAGANGLSAYQIAVNHGYIGPVLDWLDSLIGPPGVNGNDGKNGRDGLPGKNGKSAYRIAVENGFDGTIEDWLESLHLPIEGDIPVKPVTQQEYNNLSQQEKMSRTLWLITDAKPKPVTIYKFGFGLVSEADKNYVNVSVDVANDFEGDNTRPVAANLVKTTTDKLTANLEDVNNDLAETKVKVADNQTEIAKINSIIAEDQAKITDNQTEITEIKSTLETMQDEIDSFDDILGHILAELKTI